MQTACFSLYLKHPLRTLVATMIMLVFAQWCFHSLDVRHINPVYVLIHDFYLDYMHAAAAAAKSLQSCPTLCDPIDVSPSGSAIPGILQAKTMDGAGCHFLLPCMKVKSEVAQSCLTQQPHGLQPTRLLRPCKLSGKSTGVGHHGLLQTTCIGVHK